MASPLLLAVFSLSIAVIAGMVRWRLGLPEQTRREEFGLGITGWAHVNGRDALT